MNLWPRIINRGALYRYASVRRPNFRRVAVPAANRTYCNKLSIEEFSKHLHECLPSTDKTSTLGALLNCLTIKVPRANALCSCRFFWRTGFNMSALSAK